MGVADGAVVSTTKIVDHGPDASRWCLVILAEGYQAAELPKFRTDAEAFVAQLFATPPFTEMWCAVNVFRVDISSTDSGADEPVACADEPAPGTGSGATPRTYFDASYCNNGMRRLLYGDEALALVTASTAVPEVDATVVIVNNPIYGGAGGSAAWFSTAPAASEIGIHELGHSAFRLADEYGGGTTGPWPGGEPVEPNVTTDTARATTKWRDLIAATTPLPTQARAPRPCVGPDTEAASPVAADVVGLFEGGSIFNCGIYHPMHTCKMRLLGEPFCVVCRRAIVAVLRPHLPAFSGPHTGRQFTGPVAPRQTVTWFTYDWPACWHTVWTVVPTAPVTPVGGVRWEVRVQRTSRERLQYWVAVTNETDQPVTVDGRYEVVATV